MRDLSIDKTNSLTLVDPVSGSDIELYYRTPLTENHVKYHAGLVRREGKKIVNVAFQNRVKRGLELITGFREGDFGYGGKPISSDPASPNYRPDWKELLGKTAPDIISAFSLVVFEGAYARPDVEEGGEKGVESEEAEEETPLPKSSGVS